MARIVLNPVKSYRLNFNKSLAKSYVLLEQGAAILARQDIVSVGLILLGLDRRSRPGRGSGDPLGAFCDLLSLAKESAYGPQQKKNDLCRAG